MGINQVSFAGNNAISKQGNEYKKTNAGKITGAAIGTTASAALGLAAIKVSKDKEFRAEMKTKITEAFKKEPFKGFMAKNPAFNMEKFTKLTKRSLVGGLIATSIVKIAVLVGVGALIDGAINHRRAKKADKAAQA